MSRSSQTVTSVIWEKLQRLPAGKRAAVLNFVEMLESARSQRGSEPAIYDYTATIVRRKRLKKLSLAKIAAIVRQVRNGHDSARGL
jgi:hypothetical protein